MTVGAFAPLAFAGMSPMTRSRSPIGTSSASPPARFTKSRTHSAARRTWSRCAGSALTLGIAMNSRSSSTQVCSTGGESTWTEIRLVPERDELGLGDVAKLDRFGQGAELLQALVLDLPDSLARDVERPADLVQRPRMLAVEPVPKLEHLTLPARERAEDLAQGLLAHGDLGLFVRQRHVLVGDEVPELRLVFVADGFLERDRRLRASADVLHLIARQVEVAADLHGRRLAAELGAELPLGTDDLVQLLDDVNRHPDRARLVRERPRNGLADPPGRVRRELEALAVVELLRGANEPDRAFLDQIEERQALVAVLLRDRDDKAQVRLDHLLLRAVVTALDPLRELDLLGGREQIDFADVLQEELQRVGRDLAGRFDRPLFLFDCHDDLDVKLLESVVEVVDLGRLEVELIERDGNLVGCELSALPPGFEQCLCVIRLE